MANSTERIERGRRTHWYRIDGKYGRAEDGLMMIETDLRSGITTGLLYGLDDSASHRIGGPSVLHRDPDTGIVEYEEYWLNGEKHREDGPAVICRSKDTGIVTAEEYWRHGQLSRTKGPVVIERDPQTGIVTRTEPGPPKRLQDLNPENPEL